MNSTAYLVVIGQANNDTQLDEIDAFCQQNGLGVQGTRPLSGLRNPVQAIEFALSGDTDIKVAQQRLKKLSCHQSLELALIPASFRQKPLGLACFDMDSTLIDHEVMDEIAAVAGIGERISAITESAMRGEISFVESFTQRLALLEGFDTQHLAAIANSLRFNPGAIQLIKTLKARGVKVAIMSGGFSYFAEHLQKELGDVDYIFSNDLEISEGKLTGKITNELVNEARKATLIEQLAKENGLSLEQTIAVGDGANDLPMLAKAGLGISYHGKPIVREQAPALINHFGLETVLYYLGLSDDEFAHSDPAVSGD